jgi:hypothetical protein
LPFAALALALALALTGCGADSGSKVRGDRGTAGGSAANAGGATGSPFGAGGDGAIFTGIGGLSSQFADAATCAAVVRKGETLALDIYLLLDKSSSMLETTGSGATKWDSVRSALESFVTANESEGLGIGLQYFPLYKPGVPATCTSHAQCGGGGPCFTTACSNNTTLVPCTTDTQCGGERNTCLPFGICEYYPVGGSPMYCQPVGGACRPAQYGNCVDFPDRWCVNGIDCTAQTYATPAVAITTLPGGAQAIVTSIDAAQPEGRTPTAPALQGAVTQAQQWAKAHPDHKVAAVLATDGLPTECTPTDIDGVARFASDGVAGTPTVPTFVIGVFGPDDTDSLTNLNKIASAGGTGKATIVDPSGDVTKEFLDALDQIRGSALLSCDFKLPAAEPGHSLDFNYVNLEVTDKAGAQTELHRVADQAGCAASPGTGWYYDVDPDVQAPSKIVVCPDVCASFQKATGTTVDLKIGCKKNIR